MTLEEYAQGQADNPDNLCRWIERQTDQMGSIRGGAARKLIVYKHANKPGWYYPPEYRSEQEAWLAVRAGFLEAFGLAREGKWDEIDGIEPLTRGPALLTKTLWAYFQDALLPITSSENLRHFLKVAGKEELAGDQTAGTIRLNRELLGALRDLPSLRSVSTKGLERLLYRRFSPFEGRVIKIAPGREGRFWEECLDGNFICVGWDEVGDLRQFESKEAFMAAFRERFASKHQTPSKLTEKANELWTLVDLDDGERIVANRGTAEVLGIGVVEPPGYVWDDSRPEYKHTVRVAWDTSYAKHIAPQARWAMKTILPLQGQAREAVLGDGGGGDSPSGGSNGGSPLSPQPVFSLIAEALARKGQVILYGPPGTGKTWSAHGFAHWWLERERASDGLEATTAPLDSVRTWLVVASPAEWHWDELFDRGEQTFRRGRIAGNYNAVSPGDLVVGYTATPAKCIEAVCRVARLEEVEGGTSFVLEPLGRVRHGPSWETLHGDDFLAESEPIRNRMQGTLFELTAEEAERIAALIAERDPSAADLLEQAPARRGEAYEWITFHPSYSYEDFVEGYRPRPGKDGVSLRLEDGVFKALCRRAVADPAGKHLLIIDEINRAHVAKVFGELMTLLEKDKRGRLSARLPYSKERLEVPENVYLLGTMNTADRSIKLLDTALRRRFAFVELMPDPELLVGSAVQGLAVSELLSQLNRRIVSGAGREKQIGHSFFMKGEQPITDPGEFAQVFRLEIVPLLQEYAFDDYEVLVDYLGERIVDREALALRQDVLSDPTLLIEALEEHLTPADEG